MNPIREQKFVGMLSFLFLGLALLLQFLTFFNRKNYDNRILVYAVLFVLQPSYIVGAFLLPFIFDILRIKRWKRNFNKFKYAPILKTVVEYASIVSLAFFLQRDG